MADNYKEFDKASIITTGTDVSIRGHTFKRREILLGIGLVVTLIVIVIMAAVLGSRGSGSSDTAPKAALQTGNNGTFDITTMATPTRTWTWTWTLFSTSTSASTSTSTSTSASNSASTSTLASAPKPDICDTPNCLLGAAHIQAKLNKSFNPCTDFYNYACGSYPSYHPRHPDSNVRNVLGDIYNYNQARVISALGTSIQRRGARSAEQKAKQYYFSCFDEYGKTNLGGNPFLKKVISKVGGWYVIDTMEETYDYKNMLKKVHVDFWTDVLFTFSVITDWLNWNKQAIQIDLSGMGMSWTYFVNNAFSQKQTVYKQFIREVGTQLAVDANTNFTDAQIKERVDMFVDDAFRVEQQLALLTNRTNSTLNPHNDEERVSLSQLNSQTGGGTAIDYVELFKYMFDEANVDENTKVVVVEKQYIMGLTKLINDLGGDKQRIMNNYFTWRLAQKYVQELSWEYIHANRNFYVNAHNNNQFLGSQRYCLQLVTTQMSQAVSALFVRDHFVDTNRKKAMEIVDYLKDSMIDRLLDNTWMEQSTKEKAKQKLLSSQYKLGYPDFLLDDSKLDAYYDSLTITQGDHFGNTLAFNIFWKERLNKNLKMGTDKSVWNYQTYAVTAEYYNPWSELIVPAGLLQFPIYDYSLPHYINFGSIGTIMGHQLIHAIDEYGKLYKLDGSWYGTWWTNTTADKYEKLKQCVVNAIGPDRTQGPYSFFGSTQRVNLDAQRYSPEAMAEAAGLKVAFHAYKKWSAKNGMEKKMAGSTSTNEQLFFISYAQAKCFNRDPQYAWGQAFGGKVFEDTSVNLAVSQSKEFQETFQCKAGDDMVAEKRCNVY